MRRAIVAFSLLPLLAAGDAGFTDPRIEQGSFEVAPGWTVELVAREPVIANPIQMDFDDRGRLWVVCAPGYPHHYSNQATDDRIVILEDQDGDGVRETSTVFADGLRVPTGLALGYGGAFVGHGRDLLHLVDSDGDGRADQRRVIATGFGLEDSHQTINTFRWGVDGRLYFHQGLWINSWVETLYGPREMKGGGVWQLHAPSGRLEVYDRSLKQANHWGHAIDAWGDDLITAAWTTGHFDLVWPLCAAGERYRVPMQVGSGRQCGAEFLAGATMPADMQGQVVSSLFLTNTVSRYTVAEKGGSFTLSDAGTLIKAKDKHFRAIDLRIGPDGALYIADLYQEVIQHIQVMFTDPRRDHVHGRIWRLRPTDRPLQKVVSLHGLPVADLLTRLGEDAPWPKQMARRLLAERPQAEVMAGLDRWLAGLRRDESADRARVEGLWLCVAHDTPRRDLAERLLSSPVPRARAAAARALGLWTQTMPEAPALLAKAAGDEHPRVRLRAVLGLMQCHDLAAVKAVAAAAAKEHDGLLDAALREAFVRLKPVWQPALGKGFEFPSPEVRTFAESAEKMPAAPAKKQ